jgi:uncharacterized small protein (DUF1192 family)
MAANANADMDRSASVEQWPGREMAAIDDEERPKKKLVHEIGQDLALLSVEELGERIALLRDEIARLEGVKATKTASRSAADLFFRK